MALGIPLGMLAAVRVGTPSHSLVRLLTLLGASRPRIIWRHIGPNVADPALVLTTVNLGNAILSLASPSFLGLGAQPPQAEWGAMVSGGHSYFQSALRLIIAPGLTLAIVVLAINSLGDSLRDLTDPRGQFKV